VATAVPIGAAKKDSRIYAGNVRFHGVHYLATVNPFCNIA
jgi:hypothetical protein